MKEVVVINLFKNLDYSLIALEAYPKHNANSLRLAPKPSRSSLLCGKVSWLFFPLTSLWILFRLIWPSLRCEKHVSLITNFFFQLFHLGIMDLNMPAFSNGFMLNLIIYNFESIIENKYSIFKNSTENVEFNLKSMQ